MKKCYRCKEVKELNCFSKKAHSKDGLRHDCRDCCKIEKDNWARKNPDKIKKYSKEYFPKHKDRINVYRRNRRKTNINYKLADNLRCRQKAAIKGMLKVGSAVKDLGCSMSEFVNYLESLFYDNPETGEKMTWENHNYEGWHLDHIIPLCNFNLEDREEFLKASHYTNLQPLWAMENFCKSKKILT